MPIEARTYWLWGDGDRCDIIVRPINIVRPIDACSFASMRSEAEYFAVLSAAIAQTEANSFEAKGIVYDRLWVIVLQQLQEEGDDSDESIARERAAFLAAVQRIEFGERSKDSLKAKSDPTKLQSLPGPFPWRIVGRMAAVGAILFILWLGYFVVRLDSTSAARWASESPPNSLQSHLMRVVTSIHDLIGNRSATPPVVGQRAVLYEESEATATGTTFAGQAVWQRQAHAKEGIALLVDVEIPQKGLFLKLSLTRPSDKASAIGHLVEFRFLNSDRSLSDAVQDVFGILMKNDELARGVELAGRVVRVHPGLFLLGLSGTEADVEMNMRLLRERPWLDIPIVFKGAIRSLLAIEKGTTGQNAINEALRSWGHS